MTSDRTMLRSEPAARPATTERGVWPFRRTVERELLTRLPADPTPEERDRPPLLFVHGVLHGAWCWDVHWMPEAAARGWACYALSLRGHGDSDGHGQLAPRRLRDYERDVRAAMDELGRPPILIGHSTGGLVVQRVLNEGPAAAGVLVASVPPHGAWRSLTRIARRHPTDLLRVASLRSLPPRRDYFFSDRLDDRRAEHYRERLGRESGLVQWEVGLPRRGQPSSAPVLVLGGEDDALVDPVDVVHTARFYGTQARLFRGMGHSMMLDAGWRAPLEVTLRWLEDEVVDGPVAAEAS